MTLQVLISCMHQRDFSIIERSHVQTDAIVVNQCDEDKVDEFDFTNKSGKVCHVKFISTTERGLSRSRNMAINNATADVCLICDDDELFEDDYEIKILSAFEEYKRFDIILFNLKHPKKIFPNTVKKIGFFQTAKYGSYQIAFRRKAILGVRFCEIMGSGTGNGGGEENKFMLDCIRNGSMAIYTPALIATVAQEENHSLWFKGFDDKYWKNRGWTAKMIYGKPAAILYMIYTVLFRAKSYDKTNSLCSICKWIYIGFNETRQ